MKKLILITSMLFTLGCSKKEGCTDNNATNFDKEAEKNNGSCVFAAGTYQVTLDCGSRGSFGPRDLVVTNTGSNSMTMVFYAGPGIVEDVFNATLSGSSITIPSQTIVQPSVNKYYTINGFGTITGNQITLTLGIHYPNSPPGSSDDVTCNCTAVK